MVGAGPGTWLSRNIYEELVYATRSGAQGASQGLEFGQNQNEVEICIGPILIVIDEYYFTVIVHNVRDLNYSCKKVVIF